MIQASSFFLKTAEARLEDKASAIFKVLQVYLSLKGHCFFFPGELTYYKQ